MAERGEAAAAEGKQECAAFVLLTPDLSLQCSPCFTAESSAKIPQSPEELPSGASDDALEDTCGFCRFMKSGPCGQIFKACVH